MASGELPESVRQGVEVIRAEVARIGFGPGVYRMLDQAGDVLYVGKAKSLKKRVVSYTRPMLLPMRLQRMIAETRQMEFITTVTEAEALLLEASLIKSLRPKYNVLLKDDKSYPYILLTEGSEYPRLLKFRGKPTEEGQYFGPFASGYAVNETLALLQRVFMLRNCTDSYFAARKTPCLQYHIKRCTAPCVDKVTRDDYAVQVNDVRDFLTGRSREVQERLTSKMLAESESHDYEKAAMTRDRIKMLTVIQSRQSIDAANIGDADVIAMVIREGVACIQVFFFRAGQNFGNRSFFIDKPPQVSDGAILSGFMAQFYVGRPVPKIIYSNVVPDELRLLEEGLGGSFKVPRRGDRLDIVQFAERNAEEALIRYFLQKGSQIKTMQGVADLFDLDAPPRRIEVYDNSHISGTNMIGAMVVAGAEGFIKKAYRTFNIRMAEASDDYGMMREVMMRRFAKYSSEPIDESDENWPQLLLIDGGLGQLSAVHEVLDELGVSEHLTIVGIAKGEKRNAGREKFFIRGREMFQLPIDDAVLHYLQRLRDEAHRFAIGTHRAKRQKAATRSSLNDVPGIGAKRKKALLLHFGSAKAVEDASPDELEKVEGISRVLAEQIYGYFHQK